MKNGLLYRQSKLGQTGETVLQFVVPQVHRARATPYRSCKNNSGGLACPATLETALENAVSVRSLRPPCWWPH